jgi:rod shape determining protein RodA
MDFSPADLFRSTKTGSRSSLDRVNKQLSASRGTFRQKVHIGVLVATVALVAYGAIIIWSASQFKADASFSRHLLGIGIGTVLAVLVWRSDLRGISNFSTALLFIDLIVIFSPKIPGLSYTGGLGMTGWIKIPGIGLTFQPSSSPSSLSPRLARSITAASIPFATTSSSAACCPSRFWPSSPWATWARAWSCWSRAPSSSA